MSSHLRSCVVSLAVLLLLAPLPLAALQAQGPDLSRHPRIGLPPDDLASPSGFDSPQPSAGPTLPNLLDNDPRNTQVWKCGRCGAVLGMGAKDPKVEKCPACGAKLTSWFNFYIVSGVGGALLAGIIIIGLITRLVRQPRG